MLETAIRIIVGRILPAFVGAVGAFVAVNYATLHTAFCAVQ
ncbi:hypothetical protein [Pseudotabrizicola sp. 4114]|nr:hypothetical protein [Pseudorhodobacter sp. 4114]